MARKLLPALIVVAIAVAAFGGGYWLRGSGGLHPQVYTADCSAVGESGGTCVVGGTTYGFRAGVRWIDNYGALHDEGLPECLPAMSSVKRLRIAADWMWVGDSGWATVFWIDCRYIGG